MTNAEIVDAAFQVWGRNFYQKTSLSQLARELGVSKPALYRHFSNKQALNRAMLERFFDDFAASIKTDYERAMQNKDLDEGIFAIIRSIAGFYGRNVYAFIFSLINIDDRNPDGPAPVDQLKSRGVDMGEFHQIMKKEYTTDPVVMQLIFTTLTFFMAQFHKAGKSFKNPPTEEGIQQVTNVICEIINRGLRFTAEGIDNLDFGDLEKRVGETMRSVEPEPLFRAVAEAVAEAGPWAASMEMVAQRLGLSKSSLYGHFKNRKDMLRRLFAGEFKRIMEFARQSIRLSTVPAEQLYLGLFSIVMYLRSRPEFLATLNWIRTRNLDLGKPEKQEDVFRLFEEVDIELIKNRGEEEKRQVSHWILFLIINILIRPGLAESLRQAWFPQGTMKNDDIRVLFRFITLGLKGFKR